MNISIATNSANKVLLVSEGGPLPSELNGEVLTIRNVTKEQFALYKSLPNRSGTTFDGNTFSAIPIPPPSQAQLDAQANAAADKTIAAMIPDVVIALLENNKPQMDLLLGKIKFEKAKKK